MLLQIEGYKYNFEEKRWDFLYENVKGVLTITRNKCGRMKKNREKREVGEKEKERRERWQDAVK